jgi:hypothetical protein
MLAIGAVFMRTETELILKSRRVVPARLLEHGFRFKYPDWRGAARDLCHQSTAARETRDRGQTTVPQQEGADADQHRRLRETIAD